MEAVISQSLVVHGHCRHAAILGLFFVMSVNASSAIADYICLDIGNENSISKYGYHSVVSRDGTSLVYRNGFEHPQFEYKGDCLTGRCVFNSDIGKIKLLSKIIYIPDTPLYDMISGVMYFVGKPALLSQYTWMNDRRNLNVRYTITLRPKSEAAAEIASCLFPDGN